jgi:hypothetical protein
MQQVNASAKIQSNSLHSAMDQHQAKAAHYKQTSTRTKGIFLEF